MAPNIAMLLSSSIPNLLPEEYQYMDNGILINGDANVPFTDVTKVSGLDSTDVRQTAHNREGVDGGYLDAQYENTRTVIIAGTLYTDGAGFELAVDDLKGNYAPQSEAQPLYLGTDAGVRVVYGKSLGVKYDKEQLRRLGMCDFQVQVTCEDPRIYDPNIISAELIMSGGALTGRGYPKSYPYSYGPPVTGNSVTLTLAGNRTQPGIIQIYGPIANPTIAYSNTGTIMNFNLSLDAGDFLEINLNNRTVKLNGTAGRRNKLTLFGSWFLLSPGLNTFSLSGSGIVSGSTRLVVSANAAAWR
jgi:hypothetical protein